MPWNFRVMKRITRGQFTEDEFAIAEVYFEEEDEGAITGWSLGGEAGWGEAPYGETLEELKESIELMLAACDRPILDEATLRAQLEPGRSSH